MASNKIIERIERELGIPGLLNLLVERLSPTDLQSLLLEVYRQRAHRQPPANLLSEFEANRFVRPSSANPIRLLAWEQIAFAHLPDGFEPLALAPVCPLGTNSAVALVDQNRVLSTIRNTEVVADSTNVLALECALVRKKLLRANAKSKEAVHRAASHRLLRAQHYNNPNAIAHFSAFALCSAGQDQGNLRFELATLAAHIQFYLRALRAFLGASLPLRAALTDFGAVDRRTLLADHLFAPLQSAFPDVAVAMDDTRDSGR
ncbi:MAG: hypothetical protein K8I30_20835, partial [Anaerolineae bacterium]|nr:hypothetical protein [Anaerolineae bacterium]